MHILDHPLAETRFEQSILYSQLRMIDMDLDAAKTYIESIHRHFQEHIPCPLVLDTGPLRNATKGTRDYWAGPEAMSTFVCVAAVTHSVLIKIAVNLFLQFSKPKYPTKLFSDTEKTLEWIRQQQRP